MKVMFRALFVLSALMLAWGGSSRAVEWDADSGITGLGTIQKISPTNYSALHYNGTNSKESAVFKISVDNVQDNDKCRVDSESQWHDVLLEGEAALNTSATSWSLPDDFEGDPGDIGDNALQVQYDPGTTPSDEITIECMVYDMDDHGDASSEQAGPVTRSVAVYRVGVNISGYGLATGINFYEDSTSSEVERTNPSGASSIYLRKLTGVTSTEVHEDDSNFSIEAAWAPIWDPDVSGKNPNAGIELDPYIEGEGIFYYGCYGGQINVSGAASACIIAVAGAAGTLGGLSTAGVGYVVAAATISTSIASSSGNSSVSASLGAKSVIEAIDESQDLEEDEQNFTSLWPVTHAYSSGAGSGHIDLSDLNIGGAVVVPNVGGKSSFGGKADISGAYAVQDTGWISDYCGVQIWSTGTATPSSYATASASLKHGINKPAYTNIPEE